MRYIFYLLLIGITISCKEAKKSAKANSYDLIFYTSNDGPSPVEGDYALFQMDILDDQKKLLQSYRNQKRMPSIKIPPIGSKGRTQNPIPDALAQMAVNDSAGIIIPRDSVADMASEYDYVKHLEYVVVLKEILSEAEYQQKVQEYREEEQEAARKVQARLPEVESLVASTLERYKNDDLQVKYTENGVAYHIHELGSGDMPTPDRLMSAQYYGVLQSNGESFDNSFGKGRPFSFRLGRGGVIKGWDESFLNFPVGTRASVFIPAEMAYGVAGAPPQIPGNSDLYFYVEIEAMYY